MTADVRFDFAFVYSFDVAFDFISFLISRTLHAEGLIPRSSPGFAGSEER